MKDLQSLARDFVARLKRELTDEISRNPANFRREAVREVKSLLSPGPGRPADPMVSRAFEARSQGKPWKEIYPVCIANHSSLGDGARWLAEYNLRAAVRSRRKDPARAKKTGLNLQRN